MRVQLSLPWASLFQVKSKGSSVEIAMQSSYGGDGVVVLTIEDSNLLVLRELLDTAIKFVASKNINLQSRIDQQGGRPFLNNPDENGYLQVGERCMACGKSPTDTRPGMTDTIKEGWYCNCCKPDAHMMSRQF